MKAETQFIPELFLIKPEIGPHMVRHVPRLEWQTPAGMNFPTLEKVKEIAGLYPGAYIEVVRAGGWHILCDEEARIKQIRPSLNPLASKIYGSELLGPVLLWTGPIRD